MDPANTWYNELFRRGAQRTKMECLVGFRDVAVTNEPIYFLKGSCSEVPLLPKNMITLWFAIFLQDVYQIGEVVRSQQTFESF